MIWGLGSQAMNRLTSRKRLTSNVDAGADEAEECGSGNDERGGRSTKPSALAAATLRDGFALNSSHKVSQLVAQKRRRNKPYCVAACPSIPKAAWANMHWKQRRKALQRLSSTVNDAGADEVLVDSGSDEQDGPAAKPDAGPPPPVSAAAAPLAMLRLRMDCTATLASLPRNGLPQIT